MTEYHFLYEIMKNTFFKNILLIYLTGWGGWINLLIFMRTGRSGPWDGSWKFLRNHFDWPWRTNIISKKIYLIFKIIIFIPFNLLYFFSSSEGGDIHHHFYILHLDILISEFYRMIIMKNITKFINFTNIFNWTIYKII